MSSTASERCRFYALLFTIHLSNVTLLLLPAGEMTKVKNRSMDKESSFSALIQEKNNEVPSLEERVKSLEDKVEALQDSINENEAYERRDSLTLSVSSNPASLSAEICINLFKTIEANKLSLNISASDISVAQRLRIKIVSGG